MIDNTNTQKADATATVREPGAEKLSPQPDNYVVWQMVALFVLVMIGYLWWQRNFGRGLDSVPWVAALVAAFSCAIGILGDLEQKRLKKKIVRILLATGFLVPGYALVAMLLCSTAPVVVVSQQSNPLTVTLAPADSDGTAVTSASAEKDKPARLHIWSTPMGRPLILKVKGYTRKTIEVAAPVGVTISPERDLVPQILLLVRPGPDGLAQLGSGGSLQVFRWENGRNVKIAESTPGLEVSLLVGVASVAIPHDFVEDWRLELSAQKMSGISRANILRAWKTPLLVELRPAADELAPHQKLSLELRSDDGVLSECGTIELPETSGTIVDLALGRPPCLER